MADVNVPVCPQCGAPIAQGATFCTYCGEQFAAQPQQPAPIQPQPQPQPQQPVYQQPVGVDPTWPLKSKVAAGVLGIFLGGIGVHKFYMGKAGLGVLSILFCWTGIPAIVGFVEGIIYLTMSDINFQQKYRVRLQ